MLWVESAHTQDFTPTHRGRRTVECVSLLLPGLELEHKLARSPSLYQYLIVAY